MAKEKNMNHSQRDSGKKYPVFKYGTINKIRLMKFQAFVFEVT